jgi:hypothetical protein
MSDQRFRSDRPGVLTAYGVMRSSEQREIAPKSRRGLHPGVHRFEPWSYSKRIRNLD